jgi:hypothetical protein
MSLLTELIALPVTVAINILLLRSRSSAPLNQGGHLLHSSHPSNAVVPEGLNNGSQASSVLPHKRQLSESIPGTY